MTSTRLSWFVVIIDKNSIPVMLPIVSVFIFISSSFHLQLTVISRVLFNNTCKIQVKYLWIASDIDGTFGHAGYPSESKREKRACPEAFAVSGGICAGQSGRPLDPARHSRCFLGPHPFQRIRSLAGRHPHQHSDRPTRALAGARHHST